MKCKNCGGNYKTKELKCPYCGTENLIGKIWLIERESVDQEYEQVKKSGGVRNIRYVLDKVMNRIILISTILLILIYVVGMALSAVSDLYDKFYLKINRNKIEQTMEDYYNNWQFAELYDYMGKHDLFGQGYYKYAQASFIQFDYDMYKNDFLMYLSLPDEEKEDRQFLLENAVKASVRAYNIDAGLYSDETGENLEVYERFRSEMIAFWKGMLGMTQEEIDKILSKDFSFYNDEYTKFIDEIAKRRAWE